MGQSLDVADGRAMRDLAAGSKSLQRTILVAALAALVIATAASAGKTKLTITTVTPSNGSTVTNGITWQVAISNGSVSRVSFAVDGVVSWSSTSSPYLYGGGTGLLDTTTLSNGSHQLVATAYPSAGGPAAKSSVTITVANAASSPPPPPPPTAPAPTAAPTISGTTTVGQTLTASTGSWSGTTPMSYGYQWLRCDSTGGACTGISGATSSSYLLASADSGATLRVSVTASNSAGSASSQSAATGLISNPTAPPQSCVSGECLPVGNLAGWTQVFTDDFSTNVAVGGFSNCDAYYHQCFGLPPDVRSKWFAFPDGWKDASGNGTYMPSKVMSIQNGMMNLYLHSENGVRMVSAPQPIIPGGHGADTGLLYGRYAIRFRADLLVGYETTFLLWPDSEVWPRDGEIDFPEGDLAGTQWSTMNAYMHHQGATSGSDQDAFASGVPYGDWHTIVIEWLPSRVSFILDGRTIGTSTSRIPNTPMHWVLQTPTALDALASLSTAGNLQIDWVAVWTPS
jgi:hypothetical protein